MDLRIVDEREMDPALDRAIKDSMCECWPEFRDVFSRTRAWHGSHPAYSVAIEDEGRVTAHVSVHVRAVRVGDEQVTVAGIMNVIVVPDRRGRGLSAQVMGPAMDEALRRGLDFGLLFCAPEIEKVYASCGWQTVPTVEVTRIDENGNECGLPGANIAMVHPLKRADFPVGPIHLMGNDW